VSLEPPVIILPRVLPAWVPQVTMYVQETELAAASVPLPPAWQIASEERQRDYRAGRYCAELALEQLGIPGFIPGVDEYGGPAWPPGTVGSITHALGLVSAAVAPKRRCAGLGIDVEPIVSLDRAQDWAARCTTSNEVTAAIHGAQVDFAVAVMLIVSAKHALYKCLRAQIARSMAYLDASIDEVQPSPGRFRARLKTSLSPAWVGGTMVTGQFEVAGDFIYTGITLPG
jgi:enterobactin synthetase component D